MFAATFVHPSHIVTWLVVGLVVGWSAGFVMKGVGYSYGVLIDIIMGIVGAVLGGLLVRFLVSDHVGFWGSAVVAFIGACLLIVIARFVIRRRFRR